MVTYPCNPSHSEADQLNYEFKTNLGRIMILSSQGVEVNTNFKGTVS